MVFFIISARFAMFLTGILPLLPDYSGFYYIDKLSFVVILLTINLQGKVETLTGG